MSAKIEPAGCHTPITPLRSSANDDLAAASASPDSVLGDEVDADGNPIVDEFAPVMSRWARRNLRRAKGEQSRAEAQVAAALAPSVPVPAAAAVASAWGQKHQQQRFMTPQPVVASNHYAQKSRSAGPLHGGAQHSASPIPQLAELFPALSSDVLASIFQQCGRSFEGVVDYMLAHQAETTADEKRMQSALNASLAEAAGLQPSSASSSSSASASASPSPFPARVVGFDNLSQLSGDLFSLVCDGLNLFDQALLSGVSKDARDQMESGPFARVEKLDFARYASWPDSRVLSMIARFSSTTTLFFRHTRFKNFAHLSSLCFGRRIKSLSLAGCVNLGDNHLQELLGLGEFLESLDLSQNDNLTDEGLEFIATARHNSRLTKINLSDCLHISSLGVERILERLPALAHLDLKGTNVTRSILQFQNQHSQLAWLNLSTCRKLPGELSIIASSVAAGGKMQGGGGSFLRLAELSLSSNLSLKNVTISVPTLTHLNLSNAKHVLTLTLYTPRLRVLNLNGCLVLHTLATVAHQSKTLVLTKLESVNTNLCRSITALSFHNLLSSASNTLRNLSCRGCLLLSDANIALLTKERPSHAAAAAAASDDLSVSASAFSSSSSSSASAASSSSPSFCVLESLDLSGCKSASPGPLLLASRMVIESNERRENARIAEEARDHSGGRSMYQSQQSQQGQGGSRVSAGSRSESKDEQWNGGLDDEEGLPLEAEPIEA